MSFLHTHSHECVKSELELFSLPPTQTSIESSQWIHYKPVTSLGQLADRIHHSRSRGRISGSRAYHAKSSRTRKNPRATGNFTNFPLRRHGYRRPRKSFSTFPFQSGRRVFQSKTRVASKQRLRIPRVHRDIVKLFFTRKNFPSNLVYMGGR